MNHFELREGELWCEEVRLSEIAAASGTPAWVYSTATLERHYRVFHDALLAHPVLARARIAYAVKANPNLSVIATLARLGAGADTVSQGEIERALAAGVAAERILFSGVGKTKAELAFALMAGVGQINVESAAELDLLARLAAERGVRAPVALRVNPGIAAGGHAKIATAQPASKFGIALAEAGRLYASAAGAPSLRLRGLACHIGSQVGDLAPFRAAFQVMAELVGDLRRAGFEVAGLDLGGGLAAPYFESPPPPEPAAFAAMAAEVLGSLDCDLAFEPGRVIAANAGVLLARLVRLQERPDGRRILILDAGMNDLVRPALYEAFHDIRPVRPRPGPARACDVAGPVCESGDTFALARPLPPIEAGDLVAFMTAGAYGAAMSSEYNSRPLAAEILVRGDAFALVRPRQTVAEMLARERLAPWL